MNQNLLCFTDSWSRIRTEGYGFLTIPLEAGSYDNLNVETWRPLTPSHINEMKRYFVGGTPELEDLSYCGNAKDSDLLSRYGFRTVTSGQIRLRMNIIHQGRIDFTQFTLVQITCRHSATRWSICGTKESIVIL